MKAPTTKEIDNILQKFSEDNYPQDVRDGVRKFSRDLRKSIENSDQAALVVATILAKLLPQGPEALAFTAFASGIVIGYQLKETQIEKIINEV